MLPAPGKLERATRELDLCGRNVLSLHLDSRMEGQFSCQLLSEKDLEMRPVILYQNSVDPTGHLFTGQKQTNDAFLVSLGSPLFSSAVFSLFMQRSRSKDVILRDSARI